MKKYAYIMAAALVSFTACSNETGEYEANDDFIEVVPQFDETTKAIVTRAQDDNLRGAGETFWVWGDRQDASDATPPVITLVEFIRSWEMHISTDRSTFDTPTSRQRYPGTNKMNLYSVHGNFTNTPIAGTTSFVENTTVLKHVVLDDQREQLDYLNSDLLYAVTNDLVKSNAKAKLTYKHMLCKIEVVLKAGEGIEYDDVVGDATADPVIEPAPIYLQNVKRGVDFTPKKLADPTTLDAKTDRSEYWYDGQDGYGNKQSYTYATRAAMLGTAYSVDSKDQIQISVSATKNDDFDPNAVGADPLVYACAIIPPQTIAQGTKFIAITVNSHTGYYELPQAITFEAGKRYRFNLVLERKGDSYGFTPTVQKWPTSADGENGGYYVIGVDF